MREHWHWRHLPRTCSSVVEQTTDNRPMQVRFPIARSNLPSVRIARKVDLPNRKEIEMPLTAAIVAEVMSLNLRQRDFRPVLEIIERASNGAGPIPARRKPGPKSGSRSRRRRRVVKAKANPQAMPEKAIAKRSRRRKASA